MLCQFYEYIPAKGVTPKFVVSAVSMSSTGTRIKDPDILFFLDKARFQKKRKKKEWINPSGLAGWGQPGSKIQPKKLLLKLLQTT